MTNDRLKNIDNLFDSIHDTISKLPTKNTMFILALGTTYAIIISIGVIFHITEANYINDSQKNFDEQVLRIEEIQKETEEIIDRIKKSQQDTAITIERYKNAQ